MNQKDIASERMLIGGELVESISGKWDDSINPATGEVIGHSPAGDQARSSGPTAFPEAVRSARRTTDGPVEPAVSGAAGARLRVADDGFDATAITRGF